MPVEEADERTAERSSMFVVLLLEDKGRFGHWYFNVGCGGSHLEILLPYRVKGTNRLSLELKSKL